jgi:hypothetical protein
MDDGAYAACSHRSAVAGEEIHEGSKKMLDHKDPTFRLEEQKEAVFATLHRQSPLIVVLLTGRGKKTLTFTLGAVLRDPEVAIALFHVLEKVYVVRLRLSHIEHIVWHHCEAQYCPLWCQR